MRIAVLVPDGTGLRNYLFSKLLGQFDESDEIILLTVLPAEIIDEVKQLHDRKISYASMSRYRDSFTGKLLKEMITYARLRYNTRKVKNKTIMINWSRKKQNLRIQMFFALAAFLSFFFSFSYKGILWLEKKYEQHLSTTAYCKEQIAILKELKPDVLFSTHQRSLDGSVIVQAAKDMGIPTIGAIYSWDNLPKARLLVRTDSYVVWSDYMKQEMADYYPEIPSEKIIVTGTPQFEFYHDKSLHISRDEFFKEVGLNPDKKVLCFSGNDLTFPCDELYLEDVAEELVKLPEEQRPQILLRRCPVDFSGRFDKVVAKYPELIKVSDPLWRASVNGWDFTVPTYDDVKLLVNVSLHSDAVINVGSTMAHDFAVCGKPAIYINYDQPSVKDWSAVVNNQYQHFRSMPSENCVIWLNSCEEIQKIVKLALEAPQTHFEEQKKWFCTVARQPVTESSGQIAEAIKQMTINM